MVPYRQATHSVDRRKTSLTITIFHVRPREKIRLLEGVEKHWLIDYIKNF
jgi:hypothetical protein